MLKRYEHKFKPLPHPFSLPPPSLTQTHTHTLENETKVSKHIPKKLTFQKRSPSFEREFICSSTPTPIHKAIQLNHLSQFVIFWFNYLLVLYTRTHT